MFDTEVGSKVPSAIGVPSVQDRSELPAAIPQIAQSHGLKAVRVCAPASSIILEVARATMIGCT